MGSLPLQSDTGVVHNCSPTNEVFNSGVRLKNYCHWGTEGFVIIGVGKRESFTSGSDGMIIYYVLGSDNGIFHFWDSTDSLLLGSDTGICYHCDLTKVFLIIGVRQRGSLLCWSDTGFHRMVSRGAH